MKQLVLILALCWRLPAAAQELYVFSESASNMPARTVTPRISALLDRSEGRTGQRYLSELMAGINRKMMVHGGAGFSNLPAGRVRWESVYLYGKYRFLSKDGLHRHFRMAAFLQGAYARKGAQGDELNLFGDRSGVQAGMIATQLVGKLALSATVGHTEALDRERFRHTGAPPLPYQSLDYSVSAGFLVLPITYTSYEQLNVNIYLELLGQHTLDRKRQYRDLAPSVQFIFNSNSKLNLGYRFQLAGNAVRNMDRSLLVSFEHTFFNAWKGR